MSEALCQRFGDGCSARRVRSQRREIDGEMSDEVGKECGLYYCCILM